MRRRRQQARKRRQAANKANNRKTGSKHANNTRAKNNSTAKARKRRRKRRRSRATKAERRRPCQSPLTMARACTRHRQWAGQLRRRWKPGQSLSPCCHHAGQSASPSVVPAHAVSPGVRAPIAGDSGGNSQASNENLEDDKRRRRRATAPRNRNPRAERSEPPNTQADQGPLETHSAQNNFRIACMQQRTRMLPSIADNF